MIPSEENKNRWIRTKSDLYEDQVAKINSGICDIMNTVEALLETAEAYEKTKGDTIDIKCDRCGHKWEMDPRRKPSGNPLIPRRGE